MQRNMINPCTLAHRTFLSKVVSPRKKYYRKNQTQSIDERKPSINYAELRYESVNKKLAEVVQYHYGHIIYGMKVHTNTLTAISLIRVYELYI